MIITTTPNVEGRKVVEYRGIVFGEVISGVDFIMTLRPFKKFSEPFRCLRRELISQEGRAQRNGGTGRGPGANAVVGVDVDYEVLGQGAHAHGHCFRHGDHRINYRRVILSIYSLIPD